MYSENINFRNSYNSRDGKMIFFPSVTILYTIFAFRAILRVPVLLLSACPACRTIFFRFSNSVFPPQHKYLRMEKSIKNKKTVSRGLPVLRKILPAARHDTVYLFVTLLYGIRCPVPGLFSDFIRNK